MLVPNRLDRMVGELEIFRLLANEAKDYAIIVLDPVGRVCQWNIGAQRLKGYAAAEIIGESFARFYTPQDVEQGKPAQLLERAAVEGRVEDQGWRVRKNGGRYWADVVITALHDEQGRVVGFSKLVRDQCQQREVALALQASEQRYRQLAMLLPVAVYTTDREGLVTLFNPEAARVFGREPVMGKDRWCGSFRLYRPDGSLLPPDQCPMAVALKEERSVRGEEIIVERPDGTRSWVLPFPEPLRNSAGKMIGAVNVMIDVTARLQAENALRENESFLRVLIDSLPFEFWARDREERCTMENAVLRRHWGNILGQRPDDTAISPDTVAIWKSNNRRAFAGETVHGEIDYFVGGQRRTFQEIIAPVRVDDEVRGTLGLNIDITEIKKAEIALRTSERQLRAFIEEAPVAIAMFDTDMRYLAASSRWVTDFKIGGEVAGQCVYDLCPNIPERWKQAHRRGMAGAVERCEEDTFVRADGEMFWTVWEVRPWRTSTGEVGGIVIFVEDITRRKRAEEAVRQSEQRFRSLAEGIPQMVWTCTPDGQGDYINQQWADYTGIPASEQLGDKWAAVVHPEDCERVFREWRRAVARATPFESEYRIRRHDGQYRWFKALALPIFDQANHLSKWFGTCTDIQTQKDTEAVLDRAREQVANHAANLEKEVAARTADLQTTISDLEAFSYSVSHDLRSPLRAMQGYSQALLEDYAARLDDQGKDYLSRIDRAAGRLDRLVQDILCYSRVARSELPLTPVNLEVLIDDVVQNYPAFQGSHAEVVIQRPMLPVIGNEGCLTQCVSNLVANAVKFVAPGARPRIQIWTEAVGTDVRLWVEDNGIGIDPSHFDRIFQIFGKVHPDEQFEGTGIGLAIVKKAVERMGGTLGVESKPGQGSRFWVQLRGPIHGR